MNEDPKHGGWIAANILDIALLKREIAAGADVQRQVLSSDNNCYPLGLAARLGSADACRLLLEAGADPNVGRGAWGSPLCEVVEGRRLARMRRETPISDAAMREVFGVLIAHGTNPNGRERPDGYMKSYDSPLFEAAMGKDHVAVRALVELGSDVDLKVEHMKHDGAFSRTHDIATTLAHLAEITDEKGKMAVGDQDMMLTLLRLGADDARLGRRYTEVTPFQESVVVGRDKLVEYYVRERGEDIAQRLDGRTMAQIARNASTRELLRGLKTELAVRVAVDVKGVAAAKKPCGMKML